jgi:hypothetical protein
MSWKMSLDIARKPNSSQFDEEMRRGVTMSKLGAHIADLMLFDRSSLAEAQSGWETDRIFFDRYPERGGETLRILLSERAEAQSGGETHRDLVVGAHPRGRVLQTAVAARTGGVELASSSGRYPSSLW